MARLPRLAVPGAVHYLIQPALQGVPMFADDADRAAARDALQAACAAARVAVHAYALLPDELQLVATPADAKGLSVFMQAVGRRYVAAYNRRHGRAGPLWQGRFRGGPVVPGEAVLEVLLLVDTLGRSAAAIRTKAAHARLALVDPHTSGPLRLRRPWEPE